MAVKREELILRLPLELKRWLEQEAARHCSSMNSEVVRAVRARMESEQARA